MMDLMIVLTMLNLFLIDAESTTTATINQMVMCNNTDCICPCPGNSTPPSTTTTLPSPVPTPPSPALGVFTVHWGLRSHCNGEVLLTRLAPQNSSRCPLCYDGSQEARDLLSNVCERVTGCKGKPSWLQGNQASNGFMMSEDRRKDSNSCKILRVQCKVVPDKPDISGQLYTYKVMTALLCVLLLAVVMVRFAKPTVKALQTRLSDRRQSRWIGPTQSQSVSYNRGKAAVQNDTDKRLSYPALERLTVGNSREPSSNRSSYNY
ncbi:uncharacterized protein cd5 [Polymixia lowei]